MEIIHSSLILTNLGEINPYLPGWNFFSCEDPLKTTRGVGFARNNTIARDKSISEYYERSIYKQWVESAMSPFTGARVTAPRGTTGFAAHTSAEAALKNSYYEYLERLILQNINIGRVRIQLSKTPTLFPFSKIFFWANALEIKIYTAQLGTSTVNFAFATCRLKNKVGTRRHPGYLFSSCVAETHELAKQKALEDALRTAPMLFSEEAYNRDNIITKTYRYWLSDEGQMAMDKFLTHGQSSNAVYHPPIYLDACKSLITFPNRYVAYYQHNEQETVEPFLKNIPLV